MKLAVGDRIVIKSSTYATPLSDEERRARQLPATYTGEITRPPEGAQTTFWYKITTTSIGPVKLGQYRGEAIGSVSNILEHTPATT
jgi:hypothetical protein